ncbi:MAG: FAD-dependent protein [Planctomycetota bacterium]
MNAKPSKTWRVMNLSLGLDEAESALRERAAKAAGVDPARVRGFRIARKSVDARKRGGRRQFKYVVHADLVLDHDETGKRFRAAVKAGKVKEAPRVGTFGVDGLPSSVRDLRVVVVGTGPAGLYAALVLATNGAAVTIVDRGGGLARRGKDLAGFLRSRTPDPESNLLFGEGGAGTYSDGKLYTRVDDPLEVPCLEELVRRGAPADILYDARAHIGTDRLHKLLPRFRAGIEAKGGSFAFGTRLDGLVIDEGPPRRVRAVATSQGEIPCDALFLAPGHSARDTIRALSAQGVVVRAKPFQLGVRIEHPQELITKGRWGDGPEAGLLGPASYNLVCKAGGGAPGAHSFCMCPGGKIVASVNEPGTLCTNGMSNSMRSSPWANAALVTTFGPAEFGDGPFAGMEFQERLEREFFEAGGGDYTAPAQRADDFLAGRLTTGPMKTSYSFGTCPGRIDELLPERARDALAAALARFDRQIPGFAGPEGLLVGLESRSSGPVRLPRDRESFCAEGFANLYPIGEGAGFAGGIMSAAIDGARAAKRFLEGLA